MTSSRSDELVSVIIPAYEAESTLAETLRSVLAQRELPCGLEVLVVDDGSKDGTSDVARGFGEPVRLLRQANSGVGAARNHGLREARGRWVAFLDADDLWEPFKLARQLSALSVGWPWGACYTGVRLIDEEGEDLKRHIAWAAEGLRPQGWVFSRLFLDGNPVCTSSVLASRALLDRVGPFGTDPRDSEDYDMWLRMARRAAFRYLPAPLTRYRVLDASYYRADPARARMRTVRTLEQAAERWALDSPRFRRGLARRRAECFFAAGWELLEREQPSAALPWLGRSLLASPLATPAGLHLAWALVPALLRARLKPAAKRLRRTLSRSES